MITVALLDSCSESSYALFRFFMYEFASVWCRLFAALCSAWMLRLLQFDCFSENMFPGISAESSSACIIIQSCCQITVSKPFLNNSLESNLLSHESLLFCCWADGILMNSAEDILMGYLSYCNPNINCQASAFKKVALIVLWRQGDTRHFCHALWMNFVIRFEV